MAKGGGAKGEDGRAYLGVGDDLNAEDIGKSRAAVVAEGAKDEVLTFLVEDENSREHGSDVEGDSGCRQGIGWLRRVDARSSTHHAAAGLSLDHLACSD